MFVFFIIRSSETHISTGKEEIPLSNLSLLTTALAAAFAGWGLHVGLRRLALSRAKHPSLTGHVRMAKRVACQIPGYRYDAPSWYDVDGAPADIATQRRAALARLGTDLVSACPRTLEQTAAVKPHLSDLQFTSSYRVPFQFRDELMRHVQLGAFWARSDGAWLTDLDGNSYLDVTGSYGVNLLGLDFYKATIEQGMHAAHDLGPLLGGYHACVADNVARLCALSRKDEVSFHMSGTEAVMQAVRLARYHTGRKRLVRFCGAYHGWWDDVQPGPGNPMPPARDTLTLAEMSEATLQVLRSRRDIACVLVNPIQAMHINQAAPSDSALVDNTRSINFDRVAYANWLKQLRAVCSDNGIVLILDEVFLGFRLAPGGVQDYYGVDADLVTYGKTLGGGLPVGVLCGKAALMKRFRDERPVDLCFARGTFNAHPYVMTAMNAFLQRLDEPAVRQLYAGFDQLWDQRRATLNEQLTRAGLPVRLANMGTIWVVLYETPSRYNWMLQFYLRRAGILLSWVGTGRIIFTLNFSSSDFDDFATRFEGAVRHMQNDGWFWAPQGQSGKQVRKALLRELLEHRFRLPRRR
jgi:glutamate-1-semialdehyde 2,1-aminomutase